MNFTHKLTENCQTHAFIRQYGGYTQYMRIGGLLFFIVQRLCSFAYGALQIWLLLLLLLLLFRILSDSLKKGGFRLVQSFFDRYVKICMNADSFLLYCSTCVPAQCIVSIGCGSKNELAFIYTNIIASLPSSYFYTGIGYFSCTSVFRDRWNSLSVFSCYV